MNEKIIDLLTKILSEYEIIDFNIEHEIIEIKNDINELNKKYEYSGKKYIRIEIIKNN